MEILLKLLYKDMKFIIIFLQKYQFIELSDSLEIRKLVKGRQVVKENMKHGEVCLRFTGYLT